ncbi:MAG: DUF4359 domain-containing protein [Leptolyngbyaceae cyanobacterium bins.349]|nr:DUF4359 domain-containing protein [Leptolyngbyaceae cyanobacterium bins.349]
MMMESSWGRQHGLRVGTRKFLTGLGVIAVTSMGAVMAVMNPSQATYETYATQKVVALIDQNICVEAPKSFNLRQDCRSLIANNRSQIRQFIANNTSHQNFIFFSIYTTDVSVAAFLPNYRVETVGAFQRFYIYDTVRN